MKKVIIIGAGISGLSAGVYALKNGYDVEIYEMHAIAGGECTGWNRGKYHFDGCIHWLMGSKKGSSINELWRQVGALDDDVRIINSEYFNKSELNSRTLTVYRDVKRFEEHLIELSPVDKKEIKRMCRAIRGLMGMDIPSGKPFDMMKAGDFVKMMLKMMPFAPYMKYGKIDIEEFANRFEDPLIKLALIEIMPSNYSALSLLSTLASMSNGDSGWPEGGSRKFAQRIERKFTDLGGKLFLKSRVNKIIVEDGIAKGLMLSDGEKVYGDRIISATDGYEALFKLLGGEYLSDTHRRMYLPNDETMVLSSFQVWAGIDVDLSNEPESIGFDLPKPITLGGETHNRMWLKNYSFDKSMVPKGYTVLSTFFSANDFEWWETLYTDKELYKKEKENIASEIIEAIEERYPSTKGKIEQIDVATPMTYVRYCNAWRGAWMSWVTTPKLRTRFMPMRLDNLSNFIMAGQWIMPPGGLPTAVIVGKWAVQHLCAQDNRPFDAR